MNQCQKMAALYIATLRCIYLINQHNHWTVKGKEFYSLHQLFGGIYESAGEHTDMASEKLISVLGEECVDYKLQNELIYNIKEKYESMLNDSLNMSLQIEKDFRKLSKEFRECLDKEDNLTLGLDDMLCAISNDRDKHIYMLTQTLS